MSDKYRSRLAGLERADSVTIDFHKAFFQPVSCSALVVRDRAQFAQVNIAADYLNPDDRGDEGFPDLVNWSLQTTRRFDALKLWLSFRMIGAERFAAMIDDLVEKAAWLVHRLRADPRFEPLHQPQFGCVVFRYRAEESDWLNDALPKHLFRRGEAVIGHTRIDGRACLKLTLINPLTGTDDLLALLDRIDEAARTLLASRG
jgi:L-2,4-diaminobutyrate decarboxylase